MASNIHILVKKKNNPALWTNSLLTGLTASLLADSSQQHSWHSSKGLCRFMSCYIVTWGIVSYYIISRRVMPCRIESYRVLIHVSLCHMVWYHGLSFHIILFWPSSCCVEMFLIVLCCTMLNLVVVSYHVVSNCAEYCRVLLYHI